MTTCKHMPMQLFDIWEPRYRDKTVLLAARKVGDHNKIVFSKAPSMGTEPYYITGKKVKSYKKEDNGKINCYVVPLDELEPLEYQELCEHLI